MHQTISRTAPGVAGLVDRRHLQRQDPRVHLVHHWTHHQQTGFKMAETTAAASLQ